MAPPTSAGEFGVRARTRNSEFGVRARTLGFTHASPKTSSGSDPEFPVRALTPNSQKGFTYLAALIAVGVLGAVLAAAGDIASHAAKREKEAELLFVGQQYRQAIASYYERSPGGAKRYPPALEDLLQDRRLPTLQRHLRKLYRDPVTGADLAVMEAPGGGIMGVFSRSESAPAKTGNFRKRDEGLADAASYAEWKFFYQPQELSAPPGERGSPNGLSASHPGHTAK